MNLEWGVLNLPSPRPFSVTFQEGNEAADFPVKGVSAPPNRARLRILEDPRAGET